MLAPDAIHPQLEGIHDKLMNVADKKPGLLYDYPILRAQMLIS